MMKTVLFIVSLFTMICSSLEAQDYLLSQSKIGDKYVEKESNEELFIFQPIRIGYTPSALMNVYPGIQASIDFGILKWLNIPIEYGIIHNELTGKTQYQRGIRWKAGLQVMPYSTKSSYIAFGVNYLNRKTFARSRRVHVFSGIRNGYNHYDIMLKSGFEATIEVGKRITDRVSIEFGVGVGASQDILVGGTFNPNEDPFEFNFPKFEVYSGDKVLKLNTEDEEKKYGTILSLHCNVSYTLWKK